MGRVNVFIEAGNENRTESIGGRRGNPRSGWARLNTDNAGKSDCSMTLRVEVVGERQRGGSDPRKTCPCGYKWVEGRYVQPDGTVGWTASTDCTWEPGDSDLDKCPKCGTLRQGMDTRKSCFEVELPEQNDEHCEVRLVPHGHKMAQLARMGVALCVIKGMTEQVQGQTKGSKSLVKQGKKTIKFALGILEEMETEVGKTVPNVMLPGDVTLKHALACVEMCRRLAEGQRSKN